MKNFKFITIGKYFGLWILKCLLHYSLFSLQFLYTCTFYVLLLNIKDFKIYFLKGLPLEYMYKFTIYFIFLLITSSFIFSFN